MKFTILFVSALSLLSASVFGQIMLGDIAFTLYDSRGLGMEGDTDFEGDDQFAFVALNTIAMGETITFRDAELNPATLEFANNAGDEIVWTATEEVSAGTVVSFTTNTNLAVNVGEVMLVDGPAFGISSAGDNIWAILGEDSNSPDVFLAAISTTNFGGLGQDEDGNIPGTGLALGSAFAILLDPFSDEAQYTGLRTGEGAIPDYADFIADVASNWTESLVVGNNLIANTTPFVVGGSTPELTITVSVPNFSESAGLVASTGTVSVGSVQDTDLTVQLSSSDPTEVNIVDSVTILAGDLSASFDIDAVDDLLDDGDRLVTITASVLGFVEGMAEVIVADDADNPTTALSAGDILFVCFNADNEAFGFVAVADIPAGEVIFFTDEEWDDSIDDFGTTEGDIIWTSPAEGLTAGEVVIISNLNVSGEDAMVTGGGTVVENGRIGLNALTETIYAYQGIGLRQPVTFLAAIANHTGDSILNTGLTADVDALYLDDSADYGEYTALRSEQDAIADYAPMIADVANNWTQDVDGDANTLICDDTDFVIGAAVSTVIIITDSGFAGDDFFIEVAEGTTGLVVTSSDTLDFANSSVVNATIDSSNANRFLIPIAERNVVSDFFRVEAQ